MNSTSTRDRTANTSPEAAIATYRLTHGHEPSFTKLYWCIANEVGIAEAVLIQVIESWCIKNAKDYKLGFFHYEHWWTTATYGSWIEKYPAFGSARSIQRLFLSLEEKGYIISCQPLKSSGNKSKFYRVDAARIGSLIIHDANFRLSIVPKTDDAIYTKLPIVPNSDGIVPNSDGIVPKVDDAPPQNPPTEQVSDPSLLDQVNYINLNQISAKKRATEEKDFNQENQDAGQDKVAIDNQPPANNSQDGATNDKTPREDPPCGAAKIDLQNHFTFNDDPVKEPDFLAYYRSYQKTQGKEIKSVAPYITAVLNKRDEGSTEVHCLFKEWQAACRASERKISNFADNPEEVERQRERCDFGNWEAVRHQAYFGRITAEGLAKFRTHDLSSRWYEWAVAKHPERFVGIPA